MDHTEQLILRAKAGDEAALNDLLDIVVKELILRCAPCFHSSLYPDVEDAIQETMIKFLLDPLSVKATTLQQLLAWAKICVTNYMRDRLKSAARRKRAPLYYHDENGEEQASPIPSQEDFVDSVHRRLFLQTASPYLRECMAALSDDDRMVIEKYLTGERVATIAAMLGISSEATKKRKQRISERIQKCLAAKGIVEEDLQ